MKTKSFLICPVRGVSQSANLELVEQLEKEGFSVYYPARDTDQDDPTGLEICEANRLAIVEADVVHFSWDGQSQGCLFDLGVAFSLGKNIIPLSLPGIVTGKR